MKTETTLKDHSSSCERCKRIFECNPSDISACNCSKIKLSTEEYRYISSKFQLCVCNSCLQKLQEEYHANHYYNRPDNSKDRLVALLILFSVFFSIHISAQTYAPPVGQAGTSAIYMDSAVFINWASSSTITRGYQDLSNTSLGYASVGDNTMATGKAQSNGVVSLGDGGSAICTFNKPITNEAGYDFAVFENGFDDVFLELAFIEVSSDGINFFRFPAHSLTDTSNQTGSFGSTDATKINNLAGKYRGGYGTPFDLQELSGTVGLDINNITHVKVIDVVGSMNAAYASRDFYHNKINDPWPTPFPSGGFDLDAIGVIHESTITSIKKQVAESSVLIYPNPINSGEELRIKISSPATFELLDASGKTVLTTEASVIQTSGLSPGIYCLKVITQNASYIQKIIVRP